MTGARYQTEFVTRKAATEFAERAYRSGGPLSDLGRDLLAILDDLAENEEYLEKLKLAVEQCYNEDLDPDEPHLAIREMNLQLVAIRQAAASFGLPITDIPGLISMLAMGCGIESTK